MEAVIDLIYIGFRIVISESGIWVSIAPHKRAKLSEEIKSIISGDRRLFNQIESTVGKLQHYCRAIKFFRLYTSLLYDAMSTGYD